MHDAETFRTRSRVPTWCTTRRVLAAAIARIGAEIDRELAGTPAVFVTVMQGALMFAGQLATAIATPLTFDYVHATRYRGATSGGELHWIKRPSTSLAGATVLLVDDILDEGHTLKAIRDFCLAAKVPRACCSRCCAKSATAARVPGLQRAISSASKCPTATCSATAWTTHEQGRNLPAIYAVDA